MVQHFDYTEYQGGGELGFILIRIPDFEFQSNKFKADTRAVIAEKMDAMPVLFFNAEAPEGDAIIDGDEDLTPYAADLARDKEAIWKKFALIWDIEFNDPAN